MRKVAFISILITIPVWIGFYYIADRGIGFDPMTEQSLKEVLKTATIIEKSSEVSGDSRSFKSKPNVN